jgi:uncharacterized protein
MGERTSYEPGTFCWTDLGTTDAAGAKGFYTQLFGWDADDVPVGGGETYTMLGLDGKTVCALYERDDIPHPAWASYVSVADADTTTERARELGASVMMEPFDVMDAGRMALLRDPQGAVFALWQAGESFGAELVNDPGALCLNQLNTSDPEAAQRFYGELFGWRIERVGELGDSDEQPYWGAYVGERLNAGMMPLPEAARETPPHWLVYFTSADLDASVKEIGELGGEVTVPPMSVPSGRIAVARDPQGAVLALFEGRVDP